MLKVVRLGVCFFCLAAVVLSVGCSAPAHKAFDMSEIDAITETNVRATVEREEIAVHVNKSTAGDNIAAGGGLCCAFIGSMVDKSVDAQRARDAQAWVAPLLEQTADIDFRREFWDALLPTLRDLPWLKIGQTDLAVTPEELSDEWLEDDVLLVWSDYEMTHDGARLVVSTRVQFWTEPESKPSYYALFTYLSDGIGAESEDEALQQWAANGAEMYRAALEEGIRQSMVMIRMDLPGPDLESAFVSGDQAKIKTPTAEGKKKSMKGEILAADEDRLVFRLENGNILSLPIREVDIQRK